MMPELKQEKQCYSADVVYKIIMGKTTQISLLFPNRNYCSAESFNLNITNMNSFVRTADIVNTVSDYEY